MVHLELVSCLTTFQHALYASIFLSTTMVQIVRTYHTEFIIVSYVNRLITLGIFIHYLINTCTFYPSFIGIFCIMYGIHLNFMIHLILDVISIYYGHEIGVKKTTKWVTTYPFSWYKHPQYYGCILQLIGIALCVGYDNGTIRTDIWITCIYASSLYLLTIQIEKLPIPYK